jgi:hypothetical protein
MIIDKTPAPLVVFISIGAIVPVICVCKRFSPGRG